MFVFTSRYKRRHAPHRCTVTTAMQDTIPITALTQQRHRHKAETVTRNHTTAINAHQSGQPDQTLYHTLTRIRSYDVDKVAASLSSSSASS